MAIRIKIFQYYTTIISIFEFLIFVCTNFETGAKKLGPEKKNVEGSKSPPQEIDVESDPTGSLKNGQ